MLCTHFFAVRRTSCEHHQPQLALSVPKTSRSTAWHCPLVSSTLSPQIWLSEASVVLCRLCAGFEARDQHLRHRPQDLRQLHADQRVPGDRPRPSKCASGSPDSAKFSLSPLQQPCLTCLHHEQTSAGGIPMLTHQRCLVKKALEACNTPCMYSCSLFVPTGGRPASLARCLSH